MRLRASGARPRWRASDRLTHNGILFGFLVARTIPELQNSRSHFCLNAELMTQLLRLSIGACCLCFSVSGWSQIYRCTDKNGRASYSGSPCDSGGTTIRTFETHSMPTGPQMQGTELIKLMDTVDSEVNEKKRSQLMAQTHREVASYKAHAFAAAAKQAERELGVTSLEQQLSEAERLDRADPNYSKFRSDSPATAGIRDRLNQARLQIDPAITRILSKDAGYGQVLSRYERFEKR